MENTPASTPILALTEKRPRGRPPAITPDVAAQIIDCIRQGTSVVDTARLLGVCEGSIYYRLSLDSDFMSAYLDARRSAALARLEKLTSEGEKLYLAADTAEDIRRHDMKARIWSALDRSAQWHAERAAPEMYGSRGTLDVNRGVQPGDMRAQAWAARRALNVDNSESNMPAV